MDAIVAVNSCDCWSQKVIRSSMGMGLRYPVYEKESWEDVAKILMDHHLHIYLADIDSSAKSIFQSNLFQRCAIVIGSEGFGISPEASRLAAKSGGGRIYIPMARPLESLNAATASAAILSEAMRQRNTESTATSPS